MLFDMSDTAADVPEQPDDHRLEQVLGLFSVIAIVVGEVIGSGIFFKPKEVAQATEGFVGLILALWVACGIVNLCGALAMAELSAMFPHAGGTYVFLRETYGRLWSFLWAWAEFWVMRSGAIAALAVYTALAVEDIARESNIQAIAGHRKELAIGAIALLGAVNILGTRWGGGVLNVATVIKGGFVALLAVLPFVAIRTEPFELGPLWPQGVDRGLVVGIGTALAAIMWAYDGWGNVTVVAEEAHNAERNVPRGLVIGVVLLIVLYTGANLAYHLTLSSAQIAAAQGAPAIAAVERLLPSFGAKLTRAMLMVSLFGALNANILVGPRVLFAVARDHRFLHRFCRVHPRTRTPAWAIGGMCCWSCALIALGGLSWDPKVQLYEILPEWTVFGGSIFYFSAVAGVFLLRRRKPDFPRPYRTWGYPLVPALFLAFYVFFMASMYWSRPQDRMIGIGLISLGAIPYFVWGERQPRGARLASSPGA